MISNGYSELLDATIEHVKLLKARGQTHLQVSPGTLEALKRPIAAAAPSRPVSAPRATSSYQTPASRSVPGPAPVSSPSAPPVRKFGAPASPTATTPVVVQASDSSKTSAIAALREQVLGCVKCANLATSRKNIVFGVGNLDAALMFVGEAPGADEDRQGQPFVGAAGQLLNKIIVAMGLRREDVYIANILKCRPDTPGQTSGNRKPTPQEMSTCIPYLREQIRIIKPRVLVGLGATAMEGLLGNIGGIMKVRGKWHTYEGIPLMPTYHPAFLLHNQSNAEKRKVWEDMMQVMEKLNLPISEKQRGYFL